MKTTQSKWVRQRRERKFYFYSEKTYQINSFYFLNIPRVDIYRVFEKLHYFDLFKLSSTCKRLRKEIVWFHKGKMRAFKEEVDALNRLRKGKLILKQKYFDDYVLVLDRAYGCIVEEIVKVRGEEDILVQKRVKEGSMRRRDFDSRPLKRYKGMEKVKPMSDIEFVIDEVDFNWIDSVEEIDENRNFWTGFSILDPKEDHFVMTTSSPKEDQFFMTSVEEVVDSNFFMGSSIFEFPQSTVDRIPSVEITGEKELSFRIDQVLPKEVIFHIDSSDRYDVFFPEHVTETVRNLDINTLGSQYFTLPTADSILSIFLDQILTMKYISCAAGYTLKTAPDDYEHKLSERIIKDIYVFIYVKNELERAPV